MDYIGVVHNDFSSKFGVPRQSGLASQCISKIVLEEEYSVREAFRGIEQFSHLWIVWDFSEAKKESWRPTVRPPRLGGNERVGVFATRSPYRPNGIGLTCVRLQDVIFEQERVVLYVSGADMMDGTPIYDIKPYLPYADSYPEACGGFAESKKEYQLDVEIPEDMMGMIPEEKRKGLCEILSLDPRPAYHQDPNRIYGLEFAGMDIKFSVEESKLKVVQVCNI